VRWLLDKVEQQEWHGWTLVRRVPGGEDKPVQLSLHIGKTWYRKSIAVQVQAGGVVDIMAYCRSEEHARQLMAVLDAFILGDTALLDLIEEKPRVNGTDGPADS
jgi:hypothetical protein